MGGNDEVRNEEMNDEARPPASYDRRQRVSPQSRPLAKDAAEEKGIIHEITLPESLRFFGEAVEPFHARPLHPAGSLRDEASMEVEGSAHSEHESGFQLRQIVHHEALLFWGTQAYPDDVRLLPGDHALKGGAFVI